MKPRPDPGHIRGVTRQAARILALAPAIVVALAGPARAETVTRTRKVSGKVHLTVAAVAGNIVIVAGRKGQITAEVVLGHAGPVDLVPDKAHPERITLTARPAHVDKAVLAVPPGTALYLTTTSGGITVTKVGGDVDVDTTSGSLAVQGAGQLEARTINGSIDVRDIAGAAVVESVSGDVRIHTTPRDDVELTVQVTSGDVDWFGRCGAGCRARFQSLSGNVDLHLDDKSACTVQVQTRTGNVSSGRARVARSGKRRTEIQVGEGGGSIRALTFSGDLTVH